MKFRTYYDNFGETEHKDIHAETFTEPSLTDTSPSSFEPIDVKVARILRGEIVPTLDTYYEVDGKTSLEDAFDMEDPTEDDMFDFADATAIGDEIAQRVQTSNNVEQSKKQAEVAGSQGQASKASADETASDGA